FEVVRRERWMEDTEVYLVRGAAPQAVAGGRELALKLARQPSGPGGEVAERLRREAAVLHYLNSAAVPRLAAAGCWQGRSFVAAEWWHGVDVAKAASELREGGAGLRLQLLALCRSVVEAYAGVHARGVLHGDVHPHNILVNGEGEVRLVDFGAA